MSHSALESRGVRIVEVSNLGPHAHYVPSVSVLLVDDALTPDEREVIADRCLQYLMEMR